MNIEKIKQGSTVELKLTGWLDTNTVPVLEREVEALDDSVTNVILDFAELEYISSAGLRQIVTIYKKMNGNLKLRNVSGEIMNILRMTNLDKKISIEPC